MAVSTTGDSASIHPKWKSVIPAVSAAGDALSLFKASKPRSELSTAGFGSSQSFRLVGAVGLKPAPAAAIVPGPSEPALHSLARTREFLSSLGISPEPAVFLALRALMAEKLPLSAAALRQLREFIRNNPGRERYCAELGARALAADLPFDDPLVLALTGFLGGSSSQNRGDSGASLKQEASKPVGSDDATVKSVAAALQAACSAGIGQAATGKLARPDPEGCGWLYLPFQFTHNSIDFRGILRILYNYCLKCTEKIVLTLALGESVCSFALNPEDQSCTLLDNADALIDSGSLNKVLRRMGVCLRPSQEDSSVLPTGVSSRV